MTNYFIGYGSLLSHNSLKKTIKDRDFIPVIVKGFKRIFNVDLDPNSNKDLDVLNIVKDKNSFFNGILIKITDEELLKLKEREKHYVFEKVEAKDINSNKIYKNCILSIDHNLDIDLGFKKPDQSYFDLCREAAYHINENFGNMFDETTFTSDGTRVKEFLLKNPDY
ncbi:gamma-glutamylcyclotransferase [Candidatus Gracilibacteria bacterium]|nr:gamma-glutamylcyclotransferase [Candidatus Gracilibacteria bacterium]